LGKQTGVTLGRGGRRKGKEERPTTYTQTVPLTTQTKIKESITKEIEKKNDKLSEEQEKKLRKNTKRTTRLAPALYIYIHGGDEGAGGSGSRWCSGRWGFTLNSDMIHT